MTERSYRAPASLAYRAVVMGSAGAALVASGVIERSWPHAVVGASFTVAALRTLRIGARLLEDRIVVRNTFRSYDLRWHDVCAVERVAAPLRFVAGGLGLRRRTTVLRRGDGRSLPVQATQRIAGAGTWSAADEPTAVIDAAWRRATAPPGGTGASPL